MTARPALAGTDPPPLRWEVYLDADPVRTVWTPDPVIELWDGLADVLARPLADAVLIVVEAMEDGHCSRCDTGVAFLLDETDSDDGVGPARLRWYPVLVRLLTPSSTMSDVELLCEDCATDEWSAAADAGMCVACHRGHHQGCLGVYIATGEIAFQPPVDRCRCACRRAFTARQCDFDPPAHDPMVLSEAVQR